MNAIAEPTYVYAIEKTNDVGNIGWAELEVTSGGVPYVTAYRTQAEAEAEAAMRALVPEGADPWTYAGLKVSREVNRGMFVIA